MLMPVSSEFVALCKAQITLLTQAFGASISIIYLTQDLESSGQPRLVAIAAHPENLMEIDSQPNSRLLPAPLTPPQPSLNLLADPQIIDLPAGSDAAMFPRVTKSSLEETIDASQTDPTRATNSLVEQRQIVLPLIYEEGVLGLLVTRRDDRAWEDWEHHQIEAIAQSLTLACVMDQRYLWGQREREQDRLLHLQQHDLMDNLLHQFRNSLTALQTFSKLILRRLTPGDRGHELAANITHEANRLRDLAQQMEWALDATATQGARTLPATTYEEEQLGDATLEPHPIPLLPATSALSGQQLPLERCLVETILEPLLASAQAIALEKQITLYSDLPEDLPPVWANPAALREALNNLIENAIKYTPPGGQIWVNAEAPETSSDLEIAVSDTGLGIPAADLPRIFERHYRGIQAEGTIPGSGLGLAITRSLIEQMHGKIQVFSPALETKRQTPELAVPLLPGGTTFVVKLLFAIGSEETEETT